MKPFKIIASVILGAATIGGIALYKNLDGVLSHLAAERLNSPPIFEQDALHAFVCGSSSPIASLKRAQACIGVVADGQMLLFDTGAGSWRSLQSRRVQPERLTSVFVTHFHSDHFGDLGEANIQSWIWGRTNPLKVYGPEGIQDVVSGYNLAYSHDYIVRNEQAGEDLMPIAASEMIAVPLEGKTTSIDMGNGLNVTAFLVDHVPGSTAFGYRVDYGDRSIIISGDTKYSENLKEMATGADLMFHEAFSERLIGIFADAVINKTDNERAKTFVPRFSEAHTSVEDVSRMAEETGVSLTVLYHLLPPADNAVMKRLFAKERPDFIMGNDGDWFVLPVGSEKIEKKNLQ